MEFSKPARTYDEQIELLRRRGMQIDDPERARHYFKHINYYRLTAYWLPFETDHEAHQFLPGTRFEDVLNLYIFDREFRLLLLDAIERVEVSVRTVWAYYMAHTYGPHAYLDASHFSNARGHARILALLLEQVGRSHEEFIKHYRNKYTAPESPPIWAVCEVMSLGLLSQWLKQLHPSDRKAIAIEYQLGESVLRNFTHHLTYVRNLCAHHSRVWNRSLTVTMELPRNKPSEVATSVNRDANRRIYNTLVMLAYFLDRISPNHHWKGRLMDLIERHDIDRRQMGFPEDYQRLPVWRDQVE